MTRRATHGRRFLFILLVAAALATFSVSAQPDEASAASPAELLVATLLDWLGIDGGESEAGDSDPDEALPSMGFEIEPNG